MRWYVELSSLNPGASSQRLTVEAATWQGALAQGRSSARDTAPLANFTIEVLPEGYRATNALTRTRYEVSKAPADAPLVTELAADKRPASVPPPAPPASAPAPVSTDATRSAAAAVASALGRRVRSATPTPGAVEVAPTSAPALEPSPQTAAPSLPAVEEAPPAAAAPLAESQAPIAAPIPRGKVLLRKSEEPTEKAPLSYRELAVAVAEGTSSNDALAIARAHLDDVRAELDEAKAPAGRLVQLAVFDHEWTTRPLRAPLVALTWKDWKGNDPDVRTASAPVARVDVQGLAGEINSAVEAARPGKVMPGAAPAVVPPSVEAIVAPAVAAVSEPAQATSVKVAVEVAVEVPSVAAAPAAPAPAAPAAPSVPKPRISASTDPFAKPVAGRASARPDDLMSELFESMHDLHFMKDALDGADFVIELLREKIPTVVTFVHFYDINAKEFVVVKARAPQSIGPLRAREGTGIVSAALKTGKPIFVKDTVADHRWQREPYAAAGHAQPKQILVLPMRIHGRFIGALELADHTDGQSFGDAEVHALSYVAEQFAEFVNDRGVVITRGNDSSSSFQVIEPVKPPASAPAAAKATKPTKPTKPGKR